MYTHFPPNPIPLPRTARPSLFAGGPPQSPILCVSADRLNFNHIKDKTPNAALNALAQKAHLGHVSAFVSHSWHDSAESKWAALQKWRIEYKLRTGKEPTFWFTRYGTVRCSMYSMYRLYKVCAVCIVCTVHYVQYV